MEINEHKKDNHAKHKEYPWKSSFLILIIEWVKTGADILGKLIKSPVE